MKIERTALDGVMLLRGEPNRDARGYFVRLFDGEIMREHGLAAEFPQHSAAFNARAGTIRGLHYQAAPHGETKIVRCTRGALFDVLLDIRPGSSSFGKWIAVELSDQTPDQLYVPDGIAHGYQTLANDTEAHYLISTPFVSNAAKGYRFDSPSLGIRWPLAVTEVSVRDRTHPEFRP